MNFIIKFSFSFELMPAITGKSISERLKAYRVESKLSQRELAFKLNKPQSYVSKIERGERQLNLIDLNIYLDELNIDLYRFITSNSLSNTYKNYLYLPLYANKLNKSSENSRKGSFVLKQNIITDLVKNEAFNEELIKYDEDYQNDVSHSTYFNAHLNEVYNLIKSKFTRGSKLVEVGCGKGAFLKIVRNDDYFDYEGFDYIYDGNDERIQKRYLNVNDEISADIVVLRHTLEHINNPYIFLNLLKKIFTSNSMIFIEVPQFEWIIKNKVLFDFTYEHVNYFTKKALLSIFSSVELSGDFFDGQYQFCIAKLENLSENYAQDNDKFYNWIDYELEPFLKEFISNSRYLENYERIWVWGGATKGVLFINHLRDLNPNTFQKVVGLIDSNPKKQGLFAPNSKLQVIAPNSFYKLCKNDDAILIMNQNYMKEIIKTTKENCEKKLNFYSF